jgi:hypothetical protein
MSNAPTSTPPTSTPTPPTPIPPTTVSLLPAGTPDHANDVAPQNPVAPRLRPKKRGLQSVGWLLLWVLIIASYTTTRLGTQADSRLSSLVALSIVHQRNIDLNEYSPLVEAQQNYLNQHRNGSTYSAYPFGAPLVAAPLFALYEVGAKIVGAQSLDDLARHGTIPEDAEHRAAIVIALAGVFVLRRLVRRLGCSEWLQFLLVAGWALSSPQLSTAARGLWQHGPAALCLLIATYACVELALARPAAEETGRASRTLPLWAAAGTASASMAVLIRPTLIVAALTLMLAMFASVVFGPRRRRTALISSLIVGGLAVGVSGLLYTHSVFGSFAYPYQGNARLRWSGLPMGTLGLLLSPNRGVMFWCPFLVAAIVTVFRHRRRAFGGAARGITANPLRPTAIALGIGAASNLAFTGAWKVWWGGHSIGPRMMAEFITLCIALLAVLSANLLRSRSTQSDLDAAETESTESEKPAVPTPRRRRSVGAIGGTVVLIVGALFHHVAAHSTAYDSWNVRPASVDNFPNRSWDFTDLQVLRVFAPEHTGRCKNGELTPRQRSLLSLHPIVETFTNPVNTVDNGRSVLVEVINDNPGSIYPCDGWKLILSGGDPSVRNKVPFLAGSSRTTVIVYLNGYKKVPGPLVVQLGQDGVGWSYIETTISKEG